MRAIIRHCIAVLLFFFVCRLALQAQVQAKDTELTLPKAVLLSRLSKGEGIPSRAFDKSVLLKAIQTDSGRLVNGQGRGGDR